MSTTTHPLDELRLARAYLLGVADPPSPAVVAFVDAHGPVEAARRIRDRHVPTEVASATTRRADYDAAADLERATALDHRLITPEDDEWPEWAINPLRHLDEPTTAPPLALWAWGAASLDGIVREAVCVSGSRSASEYGEFVGADWAYQLTQAGLNIVSSVADGIAAAGQRGALAANGTTLALLSGSLDAGFPAGHTQLIHRIAEHGLVVSPYPPRTTPTRSRRQTQSRLLAALATATVIVEAHSRSRVLDTARTARALDRPVFALPGPITSVNHSGCHDILRDQTAELAYRVDHVLERHHRPQ